MILICLALAGCGGNRIQISEDIYSAPGTPTDIRQAVTTQAARCWPGGDDRIEGLNPGLSDLDGETFMILAGPASEGEPFFTVRFRQSAGDITDLEFPVVPDDEALTRKLKDDVLLWANGTRACP
jgi:hypothetical protein